MVEKNDYGDPLYRFRVRNSKWILEVDFIENNRPWRDGEEAKFLAGVTKEKVFDYFLNSDETKFVPQREYSAMNSREHNLCRFILHSGQYLSHNGKQYNIFEIKINQGDNIKDAVVEIGWALLKISIKYPEWNPIRIQVFEHTLAECGSFYIEWDRQTFRLCQTSYRREREIQKFTNLTELLTYIAKHHYYAPM